MFSWVFVFQLGPVGVAGLVSLVGLMGLVGLVGLVGLLGLVGPLGRPRGSGRGYSSAHFSSLKRFCPTLAWLWVCDWRDDFYVFCVTKFHHKCYMCLQLLGSNRPQPHHRKMQPFLPHFFLTQNQDIKRCNTFPQNWDIITSYLRL